MADTPETREIAAEPTRPVKTKSRKKWLLLPLGLVVLPVVVFALWSWVTLGYVYSTGTRSGYVQKLSKKGWICKTWEGELAMAPMPGTMTPQIFPFTVPDDSIALLMEKDLGKQVTITYEEHRGIPTNCFGDTGYFVTNVRAIGR